MGDERDRTVQLLRARIQTRLEGSRRLIGRAHGLARDHDRFAHAVRLRARRRAGDVVNRWPRVHGLASVGGGQQYDELLDLVLDSARLLFGDCRSISLTTVDQLGDGGRPRRTAASTGVAAEMDSAAFRFGEGPCVEALELDLAAVVRVDDLLAGGEASRWPRLARVAEELGVRSALSISVPWNADRVGLQAEQHALGAVNLYAAATHAFEQTELHALMFGAWAGSILTGMEPAETFDGDF
ncbi:hypothetical protein EV188_1151 [Actinomycetospora succinea]|uniref:GAF domain-containing protein n=1 Tax=Actinomycetospora succinea TaxID=663603 RepID=A0A4R6UIC7_9PSEU|nr:hypothetical protein [Actinomycetospora succinea]TDQ46628.1 hypothetical protein EV188_1151 [Actinomycetospora succinea]